MEAFAERARRELLDGETVRKRTVVDTHVFISPRTVQYHLRRVFLKLGISSRSQLDRVLPAAAITLPPL